MMTPPPDDAEQPPVNRLLDLGTQPRTVGLVLIVFLLILGIPTALFAYRGQTQVALGMLGLFTLMVLATAYALRKAIQAHRRGLERSDTNHDTPDP